MQRILAATDFSARSDRAIHRASLLAKQHAATLTVAHVVDDDQPRLIAEAQRQAATSLLRDLAETLRETDGIACEPLVVSGDAFEGIVRAGEQTGADLQIIGAHRRRVLRDVFVGTTAERTIRTSRRPTLMANAMPAARYKHLLLAIDFSDACRSAVHAVRALGLAKDAAISVIHVFEAPAKNLMSRASLGAEEIKEYLLDERARAESEMSAFLKDAGVDPVRTFLRPNASTIGREICEAARDAGVDLIVAATRGRSGIAKIMLGSVAEEILLRAAIDVLAVP